MTNGKAMKKKTRRAGLSCTIILHFTLSILHSLSASAESVKVSDCERDASLDVWAAADVKFCRNVMDEVFKKAGIEIERAAFDKSGLFSVSNAEVICSAFRTPALLKDYDFPIQPLGRMHFALYATPSRAMSMSGCASAIRPFRRGRIRTTTALGISNTPSCRRSMWSSRRARAQ